MKIALLHPCYWPEVRRGSERFLHELATGLLERGHEPTLITSHPGPATRTVEDGFEIVRHRRPRLERHLPDSWEDHLTHLPRSWRTLSRDEFDVAHAVFPTDGVLAGHWSRRTGRRALLSYMGVPDRGWLDSARFRRSVLRHALRGCAPVALSQVAAREFRAELGVEAEVIYPGVDLNAFAPGPGRASLPTIVCAAAVEEPRKRVDLLVEAFALVRRELPDSRLLLNRTRDGAKSERFGTMPGVELRDLDDRADLAAAYREAWVSVLPSTNEPLGLVLVEALACGTPVVGTDAFGIPEVIDRPEVGRVFEGGAEELARALFATLELTGDPTTADACRRRALSFSSERMVDAYEELYRRA